MWRSVLRIGAAVALFAVVHSVLASRPAKQFAAQAFGERNRNGLYRPFYIGQSLVTFAALVIFVGRQPGVEVYRVRAPWSLFMVAGQLAALLWLAAAARQVGLLRLSGAENLLIWISGGWSEPEPEAQGPALDAEGLARGPGPFAWSRHPLNLAFVPIFWLWPRMTTNLLAFNAAATVYLVVGSVHEEVRLRKAYGRPYVAYRRSGVPFFAPRIPPALSVPAPFAAWEADRSKLFAE
jgi:protein-S-isoprenylcysteine O-methyltransferase Ste14